VGKLTGGRLDCVGDNVGGGGDETVGGRRREVAERVVENREAAWHCLNQCRPIWQDAGRRPREEITSTKPRSPGTSLWCSRLERSCSSVPRHAFNYQMLHFLIIAVCAKVGTIKPTLLSLCSQAKQDRFLHFFCPMHH